MCFGSQASSLTALPAFTPTLASLAHSCLRAFRFAKVCLEFSTSDLCSDFSLLERPALTPLYNITSLSQSCFFMLHHVHYRVTYLACLLLVCFSQVECKHLKVGIQFVLFFTVGPHPTTELVL